MEMERESALFLRSYALIVLLLCVKLGYRGLTPIPVSFACHMSHIVALAVAPLLIAWIVVRPPRHAAIRAVNGLILCFIGILGTGFVTQGAFFTGRDVAFVDQGLAALDATLGFDWLGYMRFVDRNAWMDPYLSAAYGSICLQPVVLALLLTLKREATDFSGLISAQMLGLVVASAICAIAPAIGAFPYYAVVPALHPHLVLDDPMRWIRPIMWLRNANFEHYAKPDIGLISFPSYHSMAATFYIWYAWRLAFLRWIFLLVNMTMLAATPLHGSHYLTDVIAGIALAVVVIAVVQRILVGRALEPSMAANAHRENAPLQVFREMA